MNKIAKMMPRTMPAIWSALKRLSGLGAGAGGSSVGVGSDAVAEVEVDDEADVEVVDDIVDEGEEGVDSSLLLLVASRVSEVGEGLGVTDSVGSETMGVVEAESPGFTVVNTVVVTVMTVPVVRVNVSKVVWKIMPPSPTVLVVVTSVYVVDVVTDGIPAIVWRLTLPPGCVSTLLESAARGESRMARRPPAAADVTVTVVVVVGCLAGSTNVSVCVIVDVGAGAPGRVIVCVVVRVFVTYTVDNGSLEAG